MKVRSLHSMFFITAALATTPVLADSNAAGGDVTNSETVSLGVGPFSHGGEIGNTDNTIVTGVTFTGGFNANLVRFSGTLSSVLAPTWGNEADVQIRQGTSSNIWQNPGPDATFSTFDYDSSQGLTGDFAGGIDPATGTWDVEFFDTFDDGDGTDSESTNVNMIFEERTTLSDTDGSFSLGALNGGDTVNSAGEFALSSLFDFYTIMLNDAGLFTFITDEDPTGFVGTNVDTEIGIFDATGTLLAQDDDSGNGLYSGIFALPLAAGDYTLAVTPFLVGTSFADGFVVNPGTGTGDYSLSVSLVTVPEPGTLALLGMGCFGLLACRRRKDEVLSR